MHHRRVHGLSSDTFSPLAHSRRWVGSYSGVNFTLEIYHGMSSVGVLYIWSAEQIKRGAPNGIEGALGKAP